MQRHRSGGLRSANPPYPASYNVLERLDRNVSSMTPFHPVNGVLHAESVDLARLADAVGTPFYCYSTATLERHYRVFADAFAENFLMPAGGLNRRFTEMRRASPAGSITLAVATV